MILRKHRDLGDKISDTVQYIRLHLKDLLLLFVVFVVPLSLVAVLIGANAFGGFFAAVQTDAFKANPFKVIDPMLGVTMLLYIMSAASYSTVIYLHMRCVDEVPGKPSYFNDVANRFLPKFLSNLGYMIVLVIGAVLSAVLALIPILGILALMVGWFYAFFVLSLMMPANTIEDHAFPGPITRPFTLIRGEFWSSFGFLFILGMIFYFFSMIINMVALAIFGIASINFLSPGNAQLTSRYFIVSGIAGVIGQIFYLIIHVGVGLLFFSLREQKEGGGLESRIENLGSGDTRLPEEQY